MRRDARREASQKQHQQMTAKREGEEVIGFHAVSVSADVACNSALADLLPAAKLSTGKSPRICVIIIF
jgi:hypothetical protein